MLEGLLIVSEHLPLAAEASTLGFAADWSGFDGHCSPTGAPSGDP